MAGESKYVVRTERSIGSRVGAGGDEMVVMLEPEFERGADASGTRTFVLQGRLAVWWWAMMDGSPDHDADSLVRLAAQATGQEPDALVGTFEAYCRALEAAQLVCRTATPPPLPAPAVPVAVPSPEDALSALPPESWCLPLHLDAFVRQDLVALGSFVGGFGNATNTVVCGSNRGGNADATASTVCRPGEGFGFINAGWTGRPCNT